MHGELEVPAPALARGIAVLKEMGASGPMALDDLAARTGWPKSSLLRLLDTLIALGLVARDEAGKRYRALARIVPAGGEDDIERDVAGAIEGLAAAAAHTAEWYVPGEAGMVLVQRAEPKGAEVRVRAGIGFVRAWKGELDAVARLGHAFFRETKRPLNGMWAYVRDGVRGAVPPEAARHSIEAAARDRLAVDAALNPNGVRRLACVVLRRGAPLGVLALAGHAVPAEGARREECLRALVECAGRLEQRPRNNALEARSRRLS